MKNHDFWQKWLLVLGIAMVPLGLLLAFFNQTTVAGIDFNQYINPVFWGTTVLSAESILFQRWIYGVLGAVMAGWGVFIAFMAYYPFKRRERWSWNCLLIGFLVWFLPDTAISIYFKVYMNALINTCLFVLAILPLVAAKKHFT
jgi:hypothetical protein